MRTIRFCDTSKGIRPVLRGSCRAAANNRNSPNARSRARGVAKVSFGIPVLHGKLFCACFPCSMGTPFLTCSTPPERNALPEKGLFAAEGLEKMKNSLPALHGSKKRAGFPCSVGVDFPLSQPLQRSIDIDCLMDSLHLHQ